MQWLLKTSTIVISFAVIFLVLMFVSPGNGHSPLFSAAAAGIFGIYIGFAISNSRTRLNRINELLKIENANNLLIYRLSGIFGEKIQDKVRTLLDAYLADQIDYRLEDFDLSGKTFFELHKYIINLEHKNEKQKSALGPMISVLTTSSTNRSQIESIVAQRITTHEWVSILGLLTVLVSTLYTMSSGDASDTLLITILASAALLLVLVLRDLNNLKWQKALWTWKPLHNLFKDLDLVPYYPKIIILNGEAKVANGETVRLADYPDPYPNMGTKTVETVVYKSGK